jgi:hypothetical protein
VKPMTPGYPIQFDVDYPDRELDRVSSFSRIILASPILVVLATIGGPAFDAGRDDGGLFFAGIAGGILFIPPLLLIVFREKNPRWWFDFNLAYVRFDNRVIAYLLLLRDEYPSTDEEQAVHLDLTEPTCAPS